MGRYGTDYQFRAVVARIGLGSNLAEDSVYPYTRVDAEGKPLTGANRYVVHFPKGQFPPVGAFWSVTVSSSKQALVDNPLNRYALGDRDKLKFAADGSLRRSTYSTTRPARTRSRTGCRPRRTSSTW